MLKAFIDYDRYGLGKNWHAAIYTEFAISLCRGYLKWSDQKHAKIKKRLRKYYKNLLKDMG